MTFSTIWLQNKFPEVKHNGFAYLAPLQTLVLSAKMSFNGNYSRGKNSLQMK